VGLMNVIFMGSRRAPEDPKSGAKREDVHYPKPEEAWVPEGESMSPQRGVGTGVERGTQRHPKLRASLSTNPSGHGREGTVCHSRASTQYVT